MVPTLQGYEDAGDFTTSERLKTSIRANLDEDVDIEGSARHKQLQQRLWHALQQLSPAHREILVLRDYQDLAYSEIAETLDIPLGTVMSRLHGARKKLRSILVDDLRDLLH